MKYSDSPERKSEKGQPESALERVLIKMHILGSADIIQLRDISFLPPFLCICYVD